MRARLAAIAPEIEEVGRTELHRLKQQVEEAAALGRDLLAEIAAQLDCRVEQARGRLKEVSNAGARP